MIETPRVKLLVNARASLGEGPIWDYQKQILYWVDIMGSKLHAYDHYENQNRTFDIGQPVGAVVPRISGGVLLALHHGIGSFHPESGKLNMLSATESTLPNNRFNDGKCDPAGRFWAGTMAFDPIGGEGSLYRMDTDLSVCKVMDNITISNGLAWSLDHTTMYYIDSPTQIVQAFDYDIDTGDIHNARTVIDIPEEMGIPDGMVIDSEGMLWIAMFGGGRVCRWNPQTGRVMATIYVPVSQTTACAFGGRDLKTLFITSATIGMTDEQIEKEPYAGALFSVELSCKGTVSFQFAG